MTLKIILLIFNFKIDNLFIIRFTNNIINMTNMNTLSHLDQDGFASKFGKRVKNDDYENALKAILHNDEWKELGAKGHSYVYKHYRKEISLKTHIEMYEKLIKGQEK